MESVRWLLWDDHNIEHIARHRITPAEVEQVVYLDRHAVVFLDDTHRAGRLIVLGITEAHRQLFVVVDAPTPLEDRYVVTARPMTEKDSLVYEEGP